MTVAELRDRLATFPSWMRVVVEINSETTDGQYENVDVLKVQRFRPTNEEEVEFIEDDAGRPMLYLRGERPWMERWEQIKAELKAKEAK